METDTYINFTSSEIILGRAEDIPPLFDLFLITAKMHIYYCKYFIKLDLIKSKV